MISGYKAMWVIVAFDLSTITKRDRRRANNFRKSLIKSGFTKLQLSVYSYYVTSKEKAMFVAKGVKKNVPDNGHATIFFLTDKQFAMTKNYYGKLTQEIKQPELFTNLT